MTSSTQSCNRDYTPLGSLWPLADNLFMKRLRTALLAGPLAAFFFSAGSGRAQAPARHHLGSEIRNSLLHNLIGVTVENHDGEKLGKIKNFTLDLQSGQAEFVLVSSGGIVGVGSHLKVVPV